MKNSISGGQSVSSALGRFSSEMRFDQLPTDVQQRTKAFLLYGIAVGAASTASPLPEKVANLFHRNPTLGKSGATCLADGSTADPEVAAFANGCLLHIRMQEDAHPAGHVGVAILPAVLAAAEAQGSDGFSLLAAICGGYEVALRIGRDHAKWLSQRGFRTTPVYGAIGAAAGVARVLGLSACETTNAITLAANMGAGLRAFQDAGTEEYALHAGLSARSGLTAARLAGAGVEAAPLTFEGTAGFFAAFGKPVSADSVLRGLGDEFELMRVTYKPQPGGQFHRGIVTGVSKLGKQAAERQPKRIRIFVSPFVANFPGLRNPGPLRTYPSAFYSIPFCAGLTWVEQRITYKGLHKFDDPEINRIASLVDVFEDDSRGDYDPRIEVELTDGDVIAWQDDVGETGFFLDWKSACEMTAILCDEMGIPASRYAELVQIINDLEQFSSRELIEAAARTIKIGPAR